MKITKTYDVKSYELAEAFLEDSPDLNTEANRHELAVEIQEAIEAFLADKLRNYEPPDPPGFEGGFAPNH